MDWKWKQKKAVVKYYNGNYELWRCNLISLIESGKFLEEFLVYHIEHRIGRNSYDSLIVGWDKN